VNSLADWHFVREVLGKQIQPFSVVAAIEQFGLMEEELLDKQLGFERAR